MKGPRLAAAYEYEVLEWGCDTGAGRLYGKLYLPLGGAGQRPLMVFAHELGSTYRSGTHYAEALAGRGIAAYLFDFRGGGKASKSPGKTTGMTVLTETEDLLAVLKAARGWPFVDPARVFVFGASQGGLVATLAAKQRPEWLCALALFYPAFIIPTALHQQFESLADVPEAFDYMGWINVGRDYVSTLWDLDPYDGMEDFTKPVLLLHGDQDRIVPPQYSLRAADCYPRIDLYILRGVGHGFYSESFQEAMRRILPWLKKNGLLPEERPQVKA